MRKRQTDRQTDTETDRPIQRQRETAIQTMPFSVYLSTEISEYKVAFISRPAMITTREYTEFQEAILSSIRLSATLYTLIMARGSQK